MFCNFAQAALPAFEAITVLETVPAGTALLQEEARVDGAWVICRGTVVVVSERHRSGPPSCQIARRGDVVGLTEAVGRTPARSRAVTLTDCELRYVPAALLRRFLARSIDACLWTMHFV